MDYLPLSLFGIIFNPITIIIVVVVILLINDSKKKKAGQIAAPVNAEQAKNVPAAAPKPVAPPKPKNPMAKWNWLLYIGSFLIVLAMIYFVDSVDDSAVAPTTILLTLVIYGAGLAIHKMVDYLRPVGKAFIYSALCMIPLWLISLEAIKLPTEVIPLIVSLSFMVASSIATLTVKSQVMGYAALLSPIAFIWSFYSLFEKNLTTDASAYFFFLAPMITALLPMALWLTKPKWLPVAFRHACMGLGLVLIPLAYVPSLTLFLVPNLTDTVPLLRVLCAVFMLVYAVANWYKTKKHGFFIVVRFAAQALILAALFDALNFSLFSFSFLNKNIDYTAALVCAIAWLLTFLAQVIYSLYARCKDEKEQSLERVVGILSIVGIFITPVLCLNFERIPYAIVWLVICAVAATLGVLHSLRYKNVLWNIATVASILIAPVIFGGSIASPAWTDSAYLACYSIIGVVFLIGHYVLRGIQKRESDILSIIAISLTSLIVLGNAFSLELSGIGFLIVAVYFAVVAFIAKAKSIYEIAIYAGALSLFSFAGNIFDSIIEKKQPSIYEGRYGYYGYTPELEILRISLSAVRAHIVGLSLLLTNWIYERKKPGNKQVRVIVGYSLFSVAMTHICIGSEAIGWSIFFLIEQVACLLFAIVDKRTWLIWFSSIEIFITALSLTGGFNYIWLGIIGVVLIAIVVWQLKKNNDKLKLEQSGKPAAPAAELESKSDNPEEKPAEDSKDDSDKKEASDDSKESTNESTEDKEEPKEDHDDKSDDSEEKHDDN